MDAKILNLMKFYDSLKNEKYEKLQAVENFPHSQ